MSVLYKVTICPVKGKNFPRVSWLNCQKNEISSFEQPASDIMTTVEDHRWQHGANLAELGQKLFHFLNGAPNCLECALDEAYKKDEILHLHLLTCDETDDWPFELVNKEGRFLAAESLHLVRIASNWTETSASSPEDRHLKVLFMASAPIGVEPELDFEQEEESIFLATQKLAVDMVVEDSGSLEGLREQIANEQYDMVHLSGHADIDEAGNPFFIMEDETGCRRDVGCNELWHEALIKKPPKLLFLSGSRTGQVPYNTAAASFARTLVERYGLPAVLGWGRQVNDDQAIHAIRVLLHELSRGRSIPGAVQRTRYEAIRLFSSLPTPAWPLLRLFCGKSQRNGIVTGSKRSRPKPRRMAHIFLKLGHIKMLTEGFVGRRRQLQQSLRTLLHEGKKVGLLIHGTGGLGKSCLAGKIYERLHHHWLVPIHGRLNAVTLHAALKDAFIAAEDEEGKKILAAPKEMTEKLAILCSTSFKEKNYLLLLDDFEQNLEGANEGKPGSLLLEASLLLEILLHYLPFSGKMTQMIITSRYFFSLPVKGVDLAAERLQPVTLTSFRAAEQQKKVRELENLYNYEETEVKKELLSVSFGNPRLMEWIDQLVGQMANAEVPQLLAAVAGKCEDFVREHVIRELLMRGGDHLARFLCCFAVFRIPVRLHGVRRAAETAGLNEWEILLRRSVSLSLAEHDQTHDIYQVTPFLRDELLKELEPENKHACHEAALDYYKNICDRQDTFDPVSVEELVYHALSCENEDMASEQGGILVNRLRESLFFRESQRVGQWILTAKKKELCTQYDAFLLVEFAVTKSQLGLHRQAVDYYELAMTIWKNIHGEKHPNVATTLINLGEAWSVLGDLKKSIEYYQKALIISKDYYGDKHSQTAAVLNNLGEAWRLSGDAGKAVEYYQQAVSTWKFIYGEKHLQVAIGMNNLGLGWQALGQAGKAIECYEQALIIWKDIPEVKHHMVAATLNNLGSTWNALGEIKKAVSYYEQALRIDRAVFGKSHPKTATRLNNLGAAYFKLGQKETAKKYFQEAYEIFELFYGSDHPNSKAVGKWLEKLKD